MKPVMRYQGARVVGLPSKIRLIGLTLILVVIMSVTTAGCFFFPPTPTVDCPGRVTDAYTGITYATRVDPGHFGERCYQV